MTEPFAEGIVLPYGDGLRLSLTSKPIGTGQYLLTMAGEPVAAFVFASARDDARRAADEIAERLSVDHGVPAYMAINRFSLLDFARGVHAMLKKAERDCAEAVEVAPEIKPIRTYGDLVRTDQDLIHVSDAIRLLMQIDSIDRWEAIAPLKKIHEALFAAARQFVDAHRTETLADGFPTVEFPVVVPEQEE